MAMWLFGRKRRKADNTFLLDIAKHFDDDKPFKYFYSRATETDPYTRLRAFFMLYYMRGIGAHEYARKELRNVNKPILWNRLQNETFKELPDVMRLYRGISSKELSKNIKINPFFGTIVQPETLGVSWSPYIEKSVLHTSLYSDYFDPIETFYIMWVDVPKKRVITLFNDHFPEIVITPKRSDVVHSQMITHDLIYQCRMNSTSGVVREYYEMLEHDHDNPKLHELFEKAKTQVALEHDPPDDIEYFLD